MSRSLEEEHLERVRAYRDTEPYRKAIRKRAVWVEPLFGEAKDWHGSRRFRLRTLEKVNAEALLIAAGQNIKRLLSGSATGVRGDRHRWSPCATSASPIMAAIAGVSSPTKATPYRIITTQAAASPAVRAEFKRRPAMSLSYKDHREYRTPIHPSAWKGNLWGITQSKRFW